jgi:hypothetical protein
MAPRRKRATTTKEARDFKIRLPEDIRDRVEAKAETTGWPMNRVIINELADYPRLEKFGELADQIGHLGNLLARYGARIEWLDLSEQLLAALDAGLNAEGTAQQAALDKVRVLRNAMRDREKQATKHK